MNRNFTLLYLFNTLEDFSSELMDDSLMGPPAECCLKEFYQYLDNHLAEVGKKIVDRVIQYAGDCSDQA